MHNPHAGPRKGAWQPFLYVKQIYSDHRRGLLVTVADIQNPARLRGRRQGGVSARKDTEQRGQLLGLLRELGVRAVDKTTLQGVYITPSSCHDVALLQPGFLEPEEIGDEPDFYWVVNNTLLKLF